MATRHVTTARTGVSPNSVRAPSIPCCHPEPVEGYQLFKPANISTLLSRQGPLPDEQITGFITTYPDFSGRVLFPSTCHGAVKRSRGLCFPVTLRFSKCVTLILLVTAKYLQVRRRIEGLPTSQPSNLYHGPKRI